MAVTSLWRVKGHVGKVILYAMNKDKTSDMEIVETGRDDTDPETVLDDLLAYTERDKATNLKQFVSAVNGDPAHIREEMMAVKKFFEKTGGTTAYHGFQSFGEGEVTPDQAHTIGVKLADELWGDRYQVLVATHLDKDSHLHNHFVINTVSFVDGVKFHRTKKDYLQMREASDRLCREYGLSVIEHPQGKGKHYAEWRAEKNGEPTKNGIIKQDIDDCISQCLSYRQFLSEMQKRGYTFHFDRKYPTVTHPDFQNARRLKTLGENYTPEAIQKRIAANRRPERRIYPTQDNPKTLFYGRDKTRQDVFQNYRTVYVHFVTGLRFVRERPYHNHELQRLLGDELIKFEKRTQEQNLMIDHDLYTKDDVKQYRQKQETEMRDLQEARRILRNELRSAVRKGDTAAQKDLKDRISLLTDRMRIDRHQISVCDRILENEPKVEEKLIAIEDYAIKMQRKEREGYEHIR